ITVDNNNQKIKCRAGIRWSLTISSCSHGDSHCCTTTLVTHNVKATAKLTRRM
ncbi:hypothetical protein L9F63_024600, partial [Diploptera punctata]